MRKVIILLLLIPVILLSGCSLKIANKNESTKSINQVSSSTDTKLQDEIDRLTAEVESLKNEQTESQPVGQSVSTQNSFKTYSNEELGITFNYPNEWPEPVLIKNQYSNGSNFDNNNQWEIQLGELHKKSLEGADKYFASIRGFYPQTKKEIIDEINSDKNKGSLWLTDQFDNKQGSYVVYGEAGIVGVKNIMYFGQGGKTVKVQSIDDRLNADIYSVALSIHFFK